MPKRHWTEADDQVLRSLKAERVSDREIALRLGRTRGSVASRATNIDARTRRIVKWSPADDASLTGHYAAHLPVEEIARKLNRTIPATRLRVHTLGLVRDNRKTKLALRYGVEVLAGETDPVAILARISQEREDEVKRIKADNDHKVGLMLDNAVKAVEAGCERDFIFTAAIVSGATLQQIGDRFGITRERVRQIIEERKALGQERASTPNAHGNHVEQAPAVEAKES